MSAVTLIDFVISDWYDLTNFLTSCPCFFLIRVKTFRAYNFLIKSITSSFIIFKEVKRLFFHFWKVQRNFKSKLSPCEHKKLYPTDSSPRNAKLHKLPNNGKRDDWPRHIASNINTATVREAPIESTVSIERIRTQHQNTTLLDN